MPSVTMTIDEDDVVLKSETCGFPPGNYGVTGTVEISGHDRGTADPATWDSHSEADECEITLHPHIDDDSEIEVPDKDSMEVLEAFGLDDKYATQCLEDGLLR